MRIIHSLGWYYPDSSGGTEAYVNRLIKSLADRDVDGIVIAATDAELGAPYTHDGINVVRYSASDNDKSVVRGLTPHDGFEAFKKALNSTDADVYHQHSWNQSCGIHHVRYASSIGIPIVLTVHVPGFVCMRGTMMRFNERACDGHVEPFKCTECVAEARGLPKYLANPLSKVPRRLSELALRFQVKGKIGSAFSLKALNWRHKAHLEEAVNLANKIVVLSSWMYEVMNVNGVSQDKLLLCRHGIDLSEYQSSDERSLDNDHLNIGYLGRADPVKGIHVIIEAIKMLPEDVPVKLHIFTVNSDAGGNEYLNKLQAMAGSDRRIRFKTALAPQEIPQAMMELDVIAVPSQWLETGPFTVLEALAANTPVIGSNLGGIPENIEDGVNGRLLAPKDPEEWSAAIMEIARCPKTLSRYKHNIKKVRPIEEVAAAMHQTYLKVCTQSFKVRGRVTNT